jgi:hypothetical protein
VQVKKSREYVNAAIDWDFQVHRLFIENNLGCGKNISSGLGWVFSQVDRAIIIEDDCMPDPSFFYYCQDLLERFQDDSRILSINGFNFGYKPKKLSSCYYFSRYMNMWGWATWSRSAKLIDYDLDKWTQKSQFSKSCFLFSRIIYPFWDFDWKWVRSWRTTFDKLTMGQIDTWDYYWIYKGFEHRLYSVVPGINLVQNLGYSEAATHTGLKDHPISQVKASAIDFPLIHPKKIKRNRDYEEEFVKSNWRRYRRKGLLEQIRAFFEDLVKPLFHS